MGSCACWAQHGMTECMLIRPCPCSLQDQCSDRCRSWFSGLGEALAPAFLSSLFVAIGPCEQAHANAVVIALALSLQSSLLVVGALCSRPRDRWPAWHPKSVFRQEATKLCPAAASPSSVRSRSFCPVLGLRGVKTEFSGPYCRFQWASELKYSGDELCYLT